MTHLPIIEILLPLLGGPICILVARFASRIAQLITVLNFLCGLSLAYYISDTEVYALGNWSAIIGIEFKIDFLNLPLILLINFISFLVLCFGNNLIQSQVKFNLRKDREHLIYPILLFCQAGMLGIAMTNDLFNLYVFIEIASLTSYALTSISKDKRATIGAFNYLVLGTIGATFILIGIGFILATTGNLNMSEARNYIAHNEISNPLIAGIIFYIAGALLKLALFPLHSWMVNSYNYAASINLAFLAGISNSLGFYILIRFIYFVVGHELLFPKFSLVLQILGAAAIVIGALFALTAETFKKIVIFSSVSHIGYICILLAYPQALQVALIYIIADGFLKTSQFVILSIIEDDDAELGNLNSVMKFWLCITLMSSIGLPPTIGFLNKISLFNIIIIDKILFVIVILASVIPLFYSYRIISLLYFNNNQKKLTLAFSNRLLFYCTSSLAVILLMLSERLSVYSKLITDRIF